MRQIFIDTETTGLSYQDGHRIIEIGCIEMIDRRLTGRQFHRYINPQRDIELDALEVHGITTDFLQDKPFFEDIADELCAFIKGAELVAHNAPFDVGFIDYELDMANPELGKLTDYCKVFDTLKLARQLHPGQRNSLDALCKRYTVEHFNRELHGALLDAEILAHVYLAMTGGQAKLFDDAFQTEEKQRKTKVKYARQSEAALTVIKANIEELAAHEKFLELIKSKANGVCVWDNC